MQDVGWIQVERWVDAGHMAGYAVGGGDGEGVGDGQAGFLPPLHWHTSPGACQHRSCGGKIVLYVAMATPGESASNKSSLLT